MVFATLAFQTFYDSFAEIKFLIKTKTLTFNVASEQDVNEHVSLTGNLPPIC